MHTILWYRHKEKDSKEGPTPLKAKNSMAGATVEIRGHTVALAHVIQILKCTSVTSKLFFQLHVSHSETPV